jgi:hypothetical protein
MNRLTAKLAVFAFIGLALVLLLSGKGLSRNDKYSDVNAFCALAPCDSVFDLKKGDILARPNKILPMSIPIPGGCKLGHVAVVVEGAKGGSVEETLKEAKVIEALFYDQKTKSFLFNSQEQIRLETAWTSFGEKYQENRYRLRLALNDAENDSLTAFLNSQLNARYNVFSLKKPFPFSNKKNDGRKNWHCATLTWKSFQRVTGVDIDGNRGLLILPSDIIGAPLFNGSDQRLRF